MIHQLRSTLPTFKTVTFGPGLNVLLADRRPGASENETRNSVGKTSLIETVHFLLGADPEADSMYRRPPLEAETFEMDFDLGGARATVARSGGKYHNVSLRGWRHPRAGELLGPSLLDERHLKDDAWCELLGRVMFGLGDESEKYRPTFRALFGYFARRDRSGGFLDPFRHAEKMPTVAQNVALSYLLRIDWRLSQRRQQLADEEKELDTLKRFAKGEALQSVMGNPDALRTELFVLDDRIARLAGDLDRFQVLPEFRALEREADEITRRLASLADEDVLDRAAIEDMRRSVTGETPPDLGDLARLWAEVGLVLPEVVRQRYDDARAFHASVVRNRRAWLEQEMREAEARIDARTRERETLDARRGELLRILRSSRALDQFNAMQGELARLRGEREATQRRFDATARLGRRQDEIEMERLKLTDRLRRDLDERAEVLREIVLTFRGVSEALYDDPGTLTIGEAPRGGLRLLIEKHGAEGRGIANMQIFCFDMTLAVLAARQGRGPGFVLHDSHLFDGVDERQVAHALAVGATLAREHGFQYVVTMNSDALPRSYPKGFAVEQYVLPVRLTDAREDGGLFGMRFD